MSAKWNIPKPKKYGDNWLVWENTMLDYLDFADCNDTVDGLCYQNLNLEECINYCTGECGVGYHIKLEDDSTICVPVRTDQKRLFNPVNRLVNNEKAGFSDYNFTTFLNTNKYEFPSDQSNVVFMNDLIQIKTSKKGIGSNLSVENNDPVKIVDSLFVNVQLLMASNPLILPGFLDPIRYGMEILIILSGSSLVMSLNGENQSVVWKQLPVNNLDDTASIFRIVGDKEEGELVLFGDKVRLVSVSGEELDINKDTNTLFLSSAQGSEFVLESKMTGYYCNSDSICTSVKLDSCIADGERLRYKDLDGQMKSVYRHPGCFGLCELYGDRNGNGRYKYYIIIFLVILMIGVLFVLKTK